MLPRVPIPCARVWTPVPRDTAARICTVFCSASIPHRRRVFPRDRQKVVRALEIRFLSGRALAEVYRAGRDPLQDYAPLKIGLNPPRALLYEHIESRVHAMLARGWRDEVAASLDHMQPTVLEPMSAPAHAPAVGAVDKPFSVRPAQNGTTYAAKSGPAKFGAAKPFEFIGYREMREYVEKQKPLPKPSPPSRKRRVAMPSGSSPGSARSLTCIGSPALVIHRKLPIVSLPR